METVLERSHVLGGSELKLEPFRIEEPPEVIAIVIANCLPKQHLLRVPWKIGI